MPWSVGFRFPLVPPMGTVFMAWSSDDEIDQWLRRVGPDVTEHELDRYRQALAAVRSRGFSAGLDADASRSLAEALGESPPEGRLGGRDSSGRQTVTGIVDEYQLIELEGSDEYRLNHVGAPVFDADGAVALGLFVIGFRDALTAEQVPDLASRLVKAADAITTSLHGRRPSA